MSDDYPAFYKAFKCFFKNPSRLLICSWHVNRSIKKKFFQCVPEEKQKVVAPLLGKLYSLNSETFWKTFNQLQEFRDDPQVCKFLIYLNGTWFRNVQEASSNQQRNKKLERVYSWAYCYRKRCGK